MASTATSRLGLEKQGTGDNTATWGSELNTKTIDLIDEAIAGFESIAITGGVTLTSANYVSNQARKSALKFTGALASPANIVVPSKSKIWVIWNASGAVLTIKTASGAGAAVANGKKKLIICDGSDCYTLDYSDSSLDTSQAALDAAVADAEAAQTAAETAQTAAETAETNAETAETNAAESAAEAASSAASIAGGPVASVNGETDIVVLDQDDLSQPVYDNGTFSTGTATIDVAYGSVHELTVAGNISIDFTGWPEDGVLGTLDITVHNGGAGDITFVPTINWAIPGGEKSTTFDDVGITFSNPGRNSILIETVDGGTTLDGWAG